MKLRVLVSVTAQESASFAGYPQELWLKSEDIKPLIAGKLTPAVPNVVVVHLPPNTMNFSPDSVRAIIRFFFDYVKTALPEVEYLLGHPDGTLPLPWLMDALTNVRSAIPLPLSVENLPYPNSSLHSKEQIIAFVASLATYGLENVGLTLDTEHLPKFRKTVDTSLWTDCIEGILAVPNGAQRLKGVQLNHPKGLGAEILADPGCRKVLNLAQTHGFDIVVDAHNIRRELALTAIHRIKALRGR